MFKRKNQENNSEVNCNKSWYMKYQLLELKLFNVICIAGILAICGVSAAGYGSNAFVEMFSFASTISSVVLSVIAIIMSLWGEKSTNELKGRIDTVVKRLEETSVNINESNTETQSIVEHLSLIMENIGMIQRDIGATNEKFDSYFKDLHKSDNQDEKEAKKSIIMYSLKALRDQDLIYSLQMWVKAVARIKTQNGITKYSDVYNLVKSQKNSEKRISSYDDIFWGMIGVFIGNGVFMLDYDSEIKPIFDEKLGVDN